MTIRDLIENMTDLSKRFPNGLDSEVVLYDREREAELAVDYEAEEHGFEVLQDGERIVIEF